MSKTEGGRNGRDICVRDGCNEPATGEVVGWKSGSWDGEKPHTHAVPGTFGSYPACDDHADYLDAGADDD